MMRARGRLEGRVAVITGSTKGVGRVMAKIFAAEGARVVISGRTAAAGTEVVEEIKAAGGDAFFVQADVSSEDDVKRLIESAGDKWGRLDVLVNNAAPADFIAAGGEDTVERIPTANWDYMYKACVSGPFWACKYAIPFMRKHHSGSIVHISSMASKVGILRVPAYSAAKSALNALSRQIAVDYGKEGIRSNVIVIGFVLSGRTAHTLANDPVTGPGVRAMSLTRMGKSEDVSYAALFLSSDEAEFITGIEMPVDGGVLARAFAPDFQNAYGQHVAPDGSHAPATAQA